jgi:two-component system KDP operon response regulator KdpE
MRLSPREYELLHLLACHAGKVLTHRFILREVWGNESDVQYLRIYIRSLRQKIEANPSKPTTIKTVQGVGYCLREGGQVPGDEALFRPDSDSSASVPAISR